MAKTQTQSTHCPACNVSLNKPDDIAQKATKDFDPAANEFAPQPCKHEVHEFARRTAKLGIRMQELEGPTVSRGDNLGSISPVIKACTPATPMQLSLDELSPSDEGYCSGGKSSESSAASNHPAPKTTSTYVRRLVAKIVPTLPPTAASFKKLSEADQKKITTLIATAIVLTSNLNINAAKQADIVKPLTEFVQKVKQKDRAKSADPAEVSANDATLVDIHTKAQAAVEAVAAANKAHDALKLTPSSVIIPEGCKKQLTLPLDIDTACSYNQYKRLSIAGKLVNRLNVHGLQGETEILRGVTQVGGNYSDNGIHVFIDASNIHIGFINALKLASGLKRDTQVNGHIPFIFESLAFILERGRQVAKRSLVGSVVNEDRPQYMVDAEHCGYEVSTHERVRKLKTFNNRGYNSPNDNDWTGKPEYKARPYTKMAVVEQGVDELIHLKMAESIMDADTPTTMVLATGDANVAEFSDGFLAMVNRALKKGWKVEVIAWKESLAQAYKKMRKTNEWGDRFMILELDEYREEITGEKRPGCWW